MDYLFLLGRILYGGFFIYSGIKHFTGLGMLKGYAAFKKVSMPGPAVMVTGLLLLIGGLGVLLGVYTNWAILALVLFLVPVTFKMHDFWNDQDPNTKMTNRLNFMKNMALLGAALMLLTLAQPWPLSL